MSMGLGRGYFYNIILYVINFICKCIRVVRNIQRRDHVYLDRLCVEIEVFYVCVKSLFFIFV